MILGLKGQLSPAASTACDRLQIPWFHDGIQRQRPEETESSCLEGILEIRASMEKSLHTYLHQGEAVQHNLYYCMAASLGSSENKINSFGTSCYRIMLNIKGIDGVPNATIYSLTETAPLIERVRLRQLRFLGHVLRLPENEPVREFAMYVPTHGRRKPGRQRTLFTNYIHCLLGDPDSLLNDNQLLEMAQDRHG